MENTRFLGGEEFSLVHPSSSSCGIADGDRVTVTGGVARKLGDKVALKRQQIEHLKSAGMIYPAM